MSEEYGPKSGTQPQRRMSVYGHTHPFPHANSRSPCRSSLSMPFLHSPIPHAQPHNPAKTKAMRHTRCSFRGRLGRFRPTSRRMFHAAMFVPIMKVRIYKTASPQKRLPGRLPALLGFPGAKTPCVFLAAGKNRALAIAICLVTAWRSRRFLRIATADGCEIRFSHHLETPWLKPLCIGIYVRGIESFKAF